MNTAEITNISTKVLIKKRYRQEWIGVGIGFAIPLGARLLCFLYPHRLPSWEKMQNILILISLISSGVVLPVMFKIRRQLRKYIGDVVDMKLEEKITHLKEMDNEKAWHFYFAEGFWVGLSGFVVLIFLSIGYSMIVEMGIGFFTK